MIKWQNFDGRNGDSILTQNFIAAVDQVGLILVTGEDAADFLQNQLSNDINLIDESRLQLSSYSTPKGRMLGIFRVLKLSNGYLLITARSMVATLLPQLFKFIVGARVNLADASDYFARIALQTDRPELLEDSRLPRQSNAVLQTDTLLSMRLEAVAGQQRFLLLCLDADEAIETWKYFAAELTVAAAESWHLSEIQAGIPAIYPETAEEFVLQMTNLGTLGGVSFDKGCYPGQEIVARMQYLGKLKRRMYLARLETEQLPLPGDEMVAPGKQEIDGSGKVVDAAFDADGICHCLYVAQIKKADAAELQLLRQPETAIRNMDLPYKLEI